jgi:predicted AAA+ superfamily ATPase
MRTVFETCQPREEVLRGELREQQFAASLTRVLRGDADAVYGDPPTFFKNTYATGGLRNLLSEALGRLTGQKSASAPVIRVEASFGGGKTHNLIALYHVCRSPLAARSFPAFVPADLLPRKPLDLVAGVVGGDLDAANGIDHGDVRTFTLWGEIAYQLAGAEGYEILRPSDEQRVAPRTQVWEKLIGGDPAAIMIDEVAQHLRSARAIKASSGGTNLAEQTVAFLMSLIKFAAESPRAVLVYTLADPGDAFGKETEEVRLELAEAGSVSARQEHVLTPTAENEISAIVGHRLFAHIDRSAAKEVSRDFSDYFTRVIAQGVDLPARATRTEFRAEMALDYPFHPELLTTLNRKTSTIPNFQKTRGVLRLLAQVIRGLWQERPQDCCLIAPTT